MSNFVVLKLPEMCAGGVAWGEGKCVKVRTREFWTLEPTRPSRQGPGIYECDKVSGLRLSLYFFPQDNSHDSGSRPTSL